MLVYLVEQFGLVPAGIMSAVVFFLRYALLAGFLFAIFYIWYKGFFQSRKIQSAFPGWSMIRYEIRHALETAVVFGVMAIGIYGLSTLGLTRIYQDWALYGWLYAVVSFLVLIAVHDTYFYWLHRWMHHPRWFKVLHKVHHQSFNPTPWTSLSFHPLEAFLEIAIVPVMVLVMPLHPVVIILYATLNLMFNLMGHLGYEVFPPWFVDHPLSKWVNTSTHHNLHHARSNCNYGLYFNIWDRWMGTNAVDYEVRFREKAMPERQV